MMNVWLGGMGAAVGNHLWQSTAFAVVAWGVTLLLRKNQARVRYGVWLAASVKFLIPFSLLIGLGGMLPRPRHAVVTMPVYSAVDEVGLPFDESAPAAVPAASSHVAGSSHRAPSLAAVVAGIWGVGVLVVLGIWAGRWWQVARTLRRAVRVASGREVELLRRVEGAMGGGQRPIPLVLSREWMEPGMFGMFRPVLIWPEGLSARLEDEHIEAVMIHELAHARRRDNLTAGLHMLVEAAFWFHPLVWWMERKMVEERERACDEAVVEMGSRPGVYAESLLKAVRFCVESPLVCVAGITGADLSRRVRSIMTLRLQRLGVARQVALAMLGFVAIAGPVAFGVVRMIPVYGQVFKATGPLPSYEVVAIKPAKDEAHGASTEGEQTQYLVTAKMLIQFAYGIYSPPKMVDLNVVGGPDWINTDVFDIVGKMPAAEFLQEQNLNRSQRHERRQLMEQSLLAERFKLKMHVETRDQPVFALTVAKGGPKLAVAKDTTGSAHVNPGPGASDPAELKRGLIVRRVGQGFEMTVKGMTLDTFADALMAQRETAARPVVNQTGLTQAYDFTLRWGPESTTASDSGEVEEPGLFAAIQQQLGLKLADGKGPGEVVVVDHIEKPVFDEADVARPRTAPSVTRVAMLVSQEKGAQGPAPQLTDTACPDAGGLFAAYDVVSIKPTNVTPRFVGLQDQPDGISSETVTLAMMVQRAHSAAGLPTDDAVSGLPDWGMREYFAVQAKMSPEQVAAFAKLAKGQQAACRVRMLQAMLSDRFKLQVHHESRQVPGYELVVAKSGPKMKEVADSDPDVFIGSNGKPMLKNFMHIDAANGGHAMVVHNFSIDQLAGLLAGSGGVDHKVVNKTGLTGLYSYTLTYAMPQGAGPAPAGGSQEAALDPAPTLFNALEDQLGLKLQRGIETVDVVAVDHVGRPAAN